MSGRLIIVTGLTGCGKTTYAKSLGIPHIDFDDLFEYGLLRFNYSRFAQLASCPDEAVVMGGFIFFTDPDLEKIKKATTRSIEIVVLYTTPEHLSDCQKRSKPVFYTKEDNRKMFLADICPHIERLKDKVAKISYIFRLEDKYEEHEHEHFLNTVGASD